VPEMIDLQEFLLSFILAEVFTGDRT